MKIGKIKDVTQQIRGVSYKPKDVSEVFKEGYFELYRANNIGNYGIITSNTQFVDNSCVSEKQMLRLNDILIAASSGSKHIVGKAAQINHKIKNTSFGAFCKVLRPLENVNPKYLGFYFQSTFYRSIISSLSEGANINNIRNENLDNLEIPLPPLSVQKEIAEKLDKADALRKKDQELLKQYDELAQAIFIDMFGDPVQNEKGWEVKKVDEIILPIESLGRSLEPAYINYVDISSIDNVRKKIVTTTSYKVDERPSRAQQVLQINDVLLSTVRPNLKNIARNNISGLIGSTGFFVFRGKNEVINFNFLFEFLNSDSVTDKFCSMVSGANYPALKSSDIKKFEVIVPPLNLQNQFAEKIQNIEAQKEILKQQAQLSEELFQALLQESFSF